MNKEEKEILNLSRDLWNKFFDLPEYLPSDREDVLSKLRDIQAIVMSREAVRNNPDMFIIGNYGGKTSDSDRKDSRAKKALK